MSDFLEEAQAFDQARKPSQKHPDGLTPGLDTEKGTFVVRSDRPLTAGELTGQLADRLTEAGVDPNDWLLENERIEFRTWDMAIGNGEVQRMFYFKCFIIRNGDQDDIDIEAIVHDIASHTPPEEAPPGGDWAYIINFSDWQLGKRDGDGTAGIVARILAGIDEAAADIQSARREGFDIGRLVVVGLGDLVEGCDGFYPMQTFEVELDRRGQVKVARRLLTHAMRTFAPLAPSITAVCVGGNHGENRKNGKAFTTFADNDDVAVFESVAEILAENPQTYGHINFLVPHDELAVTVDVGGTIIGITHGHLGGRNGTAGLAHTKVWNFWRDQAFGDAPVGDADVLINGHYHYFNWCINGPRNHIQVPALDTSTWFEQASGMGTQHGMVSFLSGPKHVERLRILPCSVIV